MAVRTRPGIIDRAKLALRVFRGGIPRTPVKAAPYVWPAIRSGDPQYHLTDYTTYVEEGFNANALIYDAVMYKVRSKWLAPLRAYKGEIDNPDPVDEGHPLAQLCRRPNPYMSLMEFEALNLAYANLSGNCYIYLDRPKRDAPPDALYPLRPDRTYVVPDPRRSKSLLGYWYVPEGRTRRDGIPFLYTDIMHVKYPNPGDALEGLGEGLAPLSPAAKSGDVDNAVTDFLAEFFKRGLMPAVVLEYEDLMSDDQVARVRTRWAEVYGGTEGWLKPGVMDQGGRVNRLGYNFHEMGFETIDERNETRILGPFGVPAVLIGARVGLQNATYSNVEGLDRVFWQNTFVPELRLFESEYQYYLQAEDGAWVMYDLSDVPALQRFVMEKVASFYQLWQAGYPRDMAAQIVGLPAPPSPGGDVSYLPLSLVPSGHMDGSTPVAEIAPPKPQAPTEEMPEATEDEREEEAEKFWQQRALKARDNGADSKKASRGPVPRAQRRGWNPAQKRAIWTKVDRTATSWEGKFGDGVERAMRKQERQLLALVTKERRGALERKATVNWENVQMDWDQYFEQFAAEDWREEFMPLVKGVVADQGENWKTSLGMAFDVRNVPAESWFQDYTLEFAQPINDTTKGDVHDIVSQALAEGWTVPQMETQLGLTFDRYLDPAFTLEGRRLTEDEVTWFTDRTPRFRRELIARTETMRASNSGSHQLFKDWNVQEKEWLATMDDRVRPSHAAANGQTQPIDKPFNVGGFRMMHPHDMTNGAPIGEVAFCRCAELPVTAGMLPIAPEAPIIEEQVVAGPALIGFESSAEAQEWAMQNLQTEVLGITDVEAEWADAVLSVVQDLEKRTGAKIPVTNVRFVELPEDLHAKYSVTYGNISLNTDLDRIMEQVWEEDDTWLDVSDGETPYWANGTPQGLVCHEIGHAYDVKSKYEFSKMIAALSEQEREEIAKLSGYATTDLFGAEPRCIEAWAEIFSVIALDSPRQRYIPQSVISAVKKKLLGP